MTATEILESDANMSAQSAAASVRDDEKRDLEKTQHVEGTVGASQGLTTLDGGTITMTWKTWIVIFVSPISLRRGQACWLWANRITLDPFIYVRTIVLACSYDRRSSGKTCSTIWRRSDLGRLVR